MEIKVLDDTLETLTELADGDSWFHVTVTQSMEIGSALDLAADLIAKATEAARFHVATIEAGRHLGLVGESCSRCHAAMRLGFVIPAKP